MKEIIIQTAKKEKRKKYSKEEGKKIREENCN
jgi:hypothetical protein